MLTAEPIVDGMSGSTIHRDDRKVVGVVENNIRQSSPNLGLTNLPVWLFEELTKPDKVLPTRSVSGGSNRIDPRCLDERASIATTAVD